MNIIGLAGGSCSGKTYISNKLVKKFSKKINIISLDSYYYDLSHLKMAEREKNNFDHPSSFDFNLLVKHLKNINSLGEAKIPIYNYKRHIRTTKINIIKKSEIIIIEGILALQNQKLRNF